MEMQLVGEKKAVFQTAVTRGGYKLMDLSINPWVINYTYDVYDDIKKGRWCLGRWPRTSADKLFTISITHKQRSEAYIHLSSCLVCFSTSSITKTAHGPCLQNMQPSRDGYCHKVFLLRQYISLIINFSINYNKSIQKVHEVKCFCDFFLLGFL